MTDNHVQRANDMLGCVKAQRDQLADVVVMLSADKAALERQVAALTERLSTLDQDQKSSSDPAPKLAVDNTQ